MSNHLEVAADYDQRIKDANDRYATTARYGSTPTPYDLQVTGKWMQLSSESFKVALDAESKIIDELAGEKSITISQKEKIIKAINMTTSHQKTPAQLGDQAKAIAIVNSELVLPNLDPELRNMLIQN